MLESILRAIILSGLTPECFYPDLQAAILRTRFGDMSAAEAFDLEKIGEQLLKHKGDAPQGLFDRTGVPLPILDCLDSADKMAERLTAMVELAGNQTAVSAIIFEVNEVLAPSGKKQFAPPLKLRQLAATLIDLARRHRPLVEPLVTGRLALVTPAPDIDEVDLTKWRSANYQMQVFWILFDLQIVARKLHLTEWHTLVQPDARILTLAGNNDNIEKLWRMARLAKAACKRGEHKMGPVLEDFVDEHNIKPMGKSNEAHLRAIGELPPGRRALPFVHHYLDFLEDMMRSVVEAYRESMKQQALTTIERLRQAKASRENKEFQPHYQSEHRNSASVERFSIATVPGLVAAVLIAVDGVSTLAPSILGAGKGVGVLLKHRRRLLERKLFNIYRALFVQDARFPKDLRPLPTEPGTQPRWPVGLDQAADALVDCGDDRSGSKRMPWADAKIEDHMLDDVRLVMAATKKLPSDSDLANVVAQALFSLNTVQPRRTAG